MSSVFKCDIQFAWILDVDSWWVYLIWKGAEARKERDEAASKEKAASTAAEAEPMETANTDAAAKG